MTKPMGLEVANNSCLVGTKHCAGDNTSRTSKGDHNPCSKESCEGMNCILFCYLTEIHQRSPSFNPSKDGAGGSQACSVGCR